MSSDPFGIGSTMLWIHSVYTGPVGNWNSTVPYEALFTRYRITYVSYPFSYRIGVVFIRVCVNLIRSAPTIRYNPVPHQQMVRKWIWYNQYLFCFTCKHRNPIRNAAKPRFDNRMASMQMKLIDCLANRQRKQQIWQT